jgi:hypothetical protein
MEKNPEPRSGIHDEHPGSYFENLVSVFLVNNAYSLMGIWIQDSGSCQPWIGIRDGKKSDPEVYPGSGTVITAMPPAFHHS